MRVSTAGRVDRRLALLDGIVFATAVPFLIAAAGSMIALWLGVRPGFVPLVSIRNAPAQRQPTPCSNCSIPMCLANSSRRFHL